MICLESLAFFCDLKGVGMLQGFSEQCAAEHFSCEACGQ
jgi:hypothetical protein